MSVTACILSVSGPVLLDEERAFLREAQPWGLILMGRSCVSRDQVKALISDIHEALGRQALIFIDQEGGRVARLKAPQWPGFPAAALYGALYERDAEIGLEACRLGHRLMGRELFDLGIQADCAPVADLRMPETHDAIGNRAFGQEIEAVSALCEAALAGLSEGGVSGVIKHMPGQGRATVDSHYDLPIVSSSENDLEADFSVFSALSSQAVMGMTGHVVFSSIDPENATTVSETVISRIIRDRIGFDGLLMTDDLGMEALGGSLAERGQRALAAGCDVLLHCSGFLKGVDEILPEMETVAAAAGALDGQSAERAARVMHAIAAPSVEIAPDDAARLTDLMSQVPVGV